MPVERGVASSAARRAGFTPSHSTRYVATVRAVAHRGRWAPRGWPRAKAAIALAFASSLVAVPGRADDGATAPPADATPSMPRSNDVVTSPKLLSVAKIPYPVEARGAAEVELELVLDATGAVTEVVIVRGESPFAEATQGAAPGWRFEPARRNGRPVSARIRFVAKFSEPARPDDKMSNAGDARHDPPTSDPLDAAPSSAATAPVSITVVGKRPEPAPSFSIAEVRQLPGAFGDPFRAVEAMPGVVPIASGAPFFYVRGAPPGNVGYYYDGVQLPVLFHAAVGPAVIAPWFVDDVKLFPGGYPARYGRFAGGIVTADAAAPKNEWRGAANLRVFDLGGMAEAPFAEGRGNVMIGGRYSYSAAAFSIFSPDLDVGYWDYQARVHYDVTPDDRVSVLALGALDYLSEKQNGVDRSLYDVTFHRIDARYDRRFGATRRLRLAATLGRDESLAIDPTGSNPTAGAPVEVRARSLATRAEYVDRMSDGIELRAATDAIIDTSEVEHLTSGSNGLPYFPPRDGKTFGARSDVVLDLGPFVKVVPGVRVDVYRTQGKTVPAVEPRISARFRVSDSVELFHDFGVAHQLPSFIVSVSGYQPELGNGLQRSVQLSSGVGTKWPGGIATTLSLFQNVLFNGTDRLAIAGLRTANASIAEDARSLGRTIGAELLVKRDLTRRLAGFLAYTLSRSTRSVGDAAGPAWIDRTHVLNFALGYDLGRHWRAGARVVFYTGAPARVVYPEAAENPPRSPPFYRIDWRLEKRWPFDGQRYISLVFEFFNTTLSREVMRSSCAAYACKNEVFGPVSVPSIGVESMF
jgi:hypothetical protein